MTLNEMIAVIELPAYFKQHYTTRQFYGVVEHHVRQIYTGLFGWFDEDEANLFPLPAPERSEKLIAGFGGHDSVRQAVDTALAEEEYRWAIELASWLVRRERNDRGRADAGATEDRDRLASGLRGVAYTTTAANIRNWCITRALELDGSTNLERFRTHRLQKRELARRPTIDSVRQLRVLLVPERANDRHQTLQITFSDGGATTLTIRHGVAVPATNDQPDVVMTVSSDHWFDLLGGKLNLSKAVADGAVQSDHPDIVCEFLGCFDLEALQN
jgi:alkyl sulfatase BDS1-like metallo-beta-lactamase superfamily hydrolase